MACRQKRRFVSGPRVCQSRRALDPSNYLESMAWPDEVLRFSIPEHPMLSILKHYPAD
jgi:hypothetical protein